MAATPAGAGQQQRANPEFCSSLPPAAAAAGGLALAHLSLRDCFWMPSSRERGLKTRASQAATAKTGKEEGAVAAPKQQCRAAYSQWMPILIPARQLTNLSAKLGEQDR